MFKVDNTAKWTQRLAMGRLTFNELRETIAILDSQEGGWLQPHAALLQRTNEKYADDEARLWMRVRWDAYWAVQRHMLSEDACNHIRRFLTDAHIDTALRRIVVKG
jgi:hypothetical protein